MTNELKQRLVGVAVITAIAAIFLPMLFDDPVRESGKAVNELVIPEPPQVAEPEFAPSVTESPQVYPLSSNAGEEAQDSAELNMNPALDEAEPNEALTPADLANETAADIEAAKRMTVEELVALKDKKERKKILTGKVETVNITREKSLDEKKANDKAEAIRNAKDKPVLDKKTQDKIAADRKSKEKLEADRKIKAQIEADKKTADRLAKERSEYQKLATKKAQEKALADKKVAEKMAIEAKNTAKQQALDDKAAIAKIAADKVAAKKAAANTPVNVRWYIRVGSFGQEANAITLRDKLRKQGYPAVVDTINSAEKGKLYRLRVGPELSKTLAEKTRQKMDSENNSKSILELQ